MHGEQKTQKRAVRKPRPKRSDDPRVELHSRVDRFLDNPTNPSTLDSLVAGLVDYELRARLASTAVSGHE